MRNKFSKNLACFLGGIVCAGVLLVTYRALATSYILTSLTTVNSTGGPTNLPLSGIQIANCLLTSKTLNIANNGMGTTNALVVNLQLSVDQTNFITVFTYQPSTTNAQTDTYVTPATNVTLYGRVQIFATNMGVGVVLNQ